MALLRALTRRASPKSTPITATFHHNPSPIIPHLASESARNDIHSNSSPTLYDLLSFPVGDKLRHRVKGVSQPRLNLDSILPPSPSAMEGFPIEEARKLVRNSQAARVKNALREYTGSTIAYSDYVRLCVDKCGSNQEQGRELANLMDESGDVTVLGSVVFTRPEQMFKRMADLLVCQSMAAAAPNDPRRKELEEMVKQKAVIEKKASSLVRGEFYCGLGFVVLQTLGFMRLTFWELSWDVMEPVCFFVTSLHFVVGYAFFLRTSTDPSSEGFYSRRFRVKQKKVMEAERFDMNKYNELCRVFGYNN